MANNGVVGVTESAPKEVKKTSNGIDVSEKKVNAVRILTINDVYEIAPLDPISGLSGLSVLLKKERQKAKEKGIPCFFLVNGDFLSASHIAEVYKGAHMISLFNALSTDMVVFGNHEFDFGNSTLRERISESTFTWLGSNVLEPADVDPSRRDVSPVLPNFRPFGGSKSYEVKQISATQKIGFFGVCTLQTTNISYPDADVTFYDVLKTTEKMVDILKNEEKCDLIVAVTHLSLLEDKQLCYKFPDIDIILGGHDHTPTSMFENGVFIQKSGESAEYLCKIEVTFPAPSEKPKTGKKSERFNVEWRMIKNNKKEYDTKITKLIQHWTTSYEESMSEVIGHISENSSSLDILSTKGTRIKESSFANLVTNAIAEGYGADLALLNGGFIRGNREYEFGHAITLNDCNRELPFPRHCVMLELSGGQIWRALELGVRGVDDGLGYFLHVSKGWRYVFDAAKAIGQRMGKVEKDGKNISSDSEDLFTVVVTEYMARGGDGFDVFPKGKVIKHKNDAKTVCELFVDFVRDTKVLLPKLENRIVRV